MSNPNYTTILSTTLSNYRKQLTDNVFQARPLSYFLMEKGRTRMLPGGVDIIEPLIFTAGQGGAYGGYDQLTITPQAGITAARYDWRQLYATIAISGIEELQNNGKEAIINLVEAKIMQAEETLKDLVNAYLYGAGTGAGVQGTANQVWLGLDALISGMDQTPTTPVRRGVASVGGIDGATQAYWNSIVAGATADTVLTLARMTTPFNSASKGNDKIDALFGTQALFEAYEALLIPSMRRTESKSADSGFDNLLFKGRPFYYDDDCPAKTVFGINSKYLTLVGHKDRWFKNSGFTENTASAATTSGASTVTDARYALITAAGNLTVRNRSRQFRLCNFIA